MAGALILETTFLIDLERELARGERGPAQRFLAANADRRLVVTFTVAGEVAAGIEERERWLALLAPFRVLGADDEVCWMYGRCYRRLRAAGELIGANDLWIAATALVHGFPVVTRNQRHYRRVPGLEVVGYSS